MNIADSKRSSDGHSNTNHTTTGTSDWDEWDLFGWDDQDSNGSNSTTYQMTSWLLGEDSNGSNSTDSQMTTFGDLDNLNDEYSNSTDDPDGRGVSLHLDESGANNLNDSDATILLSDEHVHQYSSQLNAQRHAVGHYFDVKEKNENEHSSAEKVSFHGRTAVP